MKPAKHEISNWDLAEIVYVIRMLVDRLERRDATDRDMEVLNMAYEALNAQPHEIHEIVNDLESAWEDERE